MPKQTVSAPCFLTSISRSDNRNWNRHGHQSRTRPRESWGDYSSQGRKWYPGLRSGVDCIVFTCINYAGIDWRQQRSCAQGLWDSCGNGRCCDSVLSYRGKPEWLLGGTHCPKNMAVVWVLICLEGFRDLKVKVNLFAHCKRFFCISVYTWKIQFWCTVKFNKSRKSFVPRPSCYNREGAWAYSRNDVIKCFALQKFFQNWNAKHHVTSSQVSTQTSHQLGRETIQTTAKPADRLPLGFRAS